VDVGRNHPEGGHTLIRSGQFPEKVAGTARNLSWAGDLQNLLCRVYAWTLNCALGSGGGLFGPNPTSGGGLFGSNPQSSAIIGVRWRKCKHAVRWWWCIGGGSGGTGLFGIKCVSQLSSGGSGKADSGNPSNSNKDSVSRGDSVSSKAALAC